ncbi:uncharacterized protein [Henckelia pumila]|uniref:uncharacterized protein n=1 Tax=Henckelia pumila TaxID=405737 RepID=UPI003C6DDDC3
MAEDHAQQAPLLPIRDHFRPTIQAYYSRIAQATINANKFKLKPALINMVKQNQFNESATTNPHMHLRTLLEITDKVKMNGVSEDIIRLRLFPFSIRDQARSWLQSLPLGSITTWEDMAVKFLAKYFLPSKSTQLKIKISTFRQHDSEQLYEAWGRYKYLMRHCPNHNFADWEEIDLFYNELNTPTRMSVDFAAGGTIFSKEPIQDYEMLEQMTINIGVYAVDPLTSISAQISAWTTQVAALNTFSIADSAGASVAMEESHPPKKVNYINPNSYRGYRGFNTNKGEGQPSLEDVVIRFVTESGKWMARTETRLDSLETHMLANALKDQTKGQFPSNTEVNPLEYCKDIELRSEKELGAEGSKAESDGKSKSVENVEIDEKIVEEKKSWFKKKALDEQFTKFLEIFKQLHINISFADVLLQMPNYAKFLKELMSKKQKLKEFETVNLTKECNMEENGYMPLIFRIPFLVSADAKIDVKKGELAMGVEGEKVIFNVFKDAGNPCMEKVFMIE